MSTYRAPKRRTIDDRWSGREMYPNRSSASSQDIERAVIELFPSQPYGTHGSVCADLLLWELVRDAAAWRSPAAYRDTIIRRVLDQYGGMVSTVLVYSANNKHTGRREPKPYQAQRLAFRRNLFATYPLAVAALERMTRTNLPTPEPRQSDPFSEAGQPPVNVEPISYDPVEPTQVEPEPEPVVSIPQMWDEPEPIKLGSILIGSLDPLRAHHEWSVGVRAIFKERGLHWSMRPTIDGLALIAAGCPPEAVRDACSMDYPDDLREQLGVREYDFAGFGIAEYVLKAMSARVIDHDGSKRPVCLALIGPAGIGKTTAIKALATANGGKLRSIDMSAGTPLSAFYGIKYIDGSFTVPDFERWALEGGLHLFGEVDSSDPNLLKVLNKGLANREYTNPVSGQVIKLCEDAVAIADSNTLGTGVQAEYSAAEQLDFSTVDRFRAGRLRCEIDEALETSIVNTQIAAYRS